MRIRICCVMIVLLTVVCLAGRAEEKRDFETKLKYKTPTELRKATEIKFREAMKYGRGPASPPESPKIFMYLADYLDAKDPKLQAAAADLVANLDYPIAASAFTKYLSEKYPLPVRMVALSRSLAWRLTNKESLNPDLHRASKEMQALWLKMVNELLAAPVAPPYFMAVTAALDPEDREWPENFIKPENQAIITRRILHGLGDVQNDHRRMQSTGALQLGLNRLVVLKEVLAWYPVETDAQIRGEVLAAICNGSCKDPKHVKIVREIVALAKQDWDPENVKKSEYLENCIEPIPSWEKQGADDDSSKLESKKDAKAPE